MRSIILASCLLLAVAHEAVALTYWVDDQSCVGNKKLDKALTETKSVGKRTSERLQSKSDTDFEHVVEFLVGMPKEEGLEEILNGKAPVLVVPISRNIC
jgi:hypothetical protein